MADGAAVKCLAVQSSVCKLQRLKGSSCSGGPDDQWGCLYFSVGLTSLVVVFCAILTLKLMKNGQQ